jgi:hypothetical protein
VLLLFPCGIGKMASLGPVSAAARKGHSRRVFFMSTKGTIVIMGSGELTSTMVEVHKELIRRVGTAGPAVFLDTPAGFQLNADQIAAKAVEYFRTRVGHPLAVASYRAKPTGESFETEKTFLSLRLAGYILIGPGSPTYALRQWSGSPIPEILTQRVEAGGSLVVASAAALTVGRFTLPVYEIYKVGEEPRWEPGIDILGRFGFNLVVVPHWNNAEGGNHDTRCCFMGVSRFTELEKLLPADVTVLGLDEHTACVLDLGKETAEIRGIGRLVLRRGGEESLFEAGRTIPLGVLKENRSAMRSEATRVETLAPPPAQSHQSTLFWDEIQALKSRFHAGLDRWKAAESTDALLELDRMIQHAPRDPESEETITQAIEIMREWIVLLGTRLSESPRDRADDLASVVEEMIDLRRRLRGSKKWNEADAIRDALRRANVLVEDTPQGPRWRLQKSQAGTSPPLAGDGGST